MLFFFWKNIVSQKSTRKKKNRLRTTKAFIIKKDLLNIKAISEGFFSEDLYCLWYCLLTFEINKWNSTSKASIIDKKRMKHWKASIKIFLKSYILETKKQKVKFKKVYFLKTSTIWVLMCNNGNKLVNYYANPFQDKGRDGENEYWSVFIIKSL